MRRIVTALLSTVTVVVLLFSYRTSTDSTMATGAGVQQGSTSASGPPDQTASSAPTPSATSSSSASPSAASSSASSSAARKVVGSVAQTRWGPVQVEITMRGGRVTSATAVQYPQGNGRDAEINSYALPVLDREVVQRQSAGIDTVSGATVTSDGYIESLQAAIDNAHL
jgi:uncharacterized protein with FMN-binding domain